jgi:hypothetical protein
MPVTVMPNVPVMYHSLATGLPLTHYKLTTHDHSRDAMQDTSD